MSVLAGKASGLKKPFPLVGFLLLDPDEDPEDSSFTPYVPLGNVSAEWDVIILMWALADTSSARVTFNGCFQPKCPNHETEDAFTQSVKSAVSRGAVIQLSVDSRDGDDTLFQIDTAAKEAAFVSSVGGIVDKFGFNGVDIYISDSACDVSGKDKDFRTPADPSSVHLIGAVQALRAARGPGFVLSVTTTISAGAAGLDAGRSCLAVVHALRDVVDVFYVEPISGDGTLYTDLDGETHAYDSPEYLAAAATLLLRDAPVKNSSAPFPALRAEQVLVLAELTHDARDAYYRVNASAVRDAMGCVVHGEGCGAPAGGSAFPAFGGFAADTINDDARDGDPYRSAMAPYLDALANGSSLSSSSSGSTINVPGNPSATASTDSTAGRAGRAVPVVPIVVPVVVVLLASVALCFFLRRRARRRLDTQADPYIPEPNAGEEMVESAPMFQGDGEPSPRRTKGRLVMEAPATDGPPEPVPPERLVDLQDAIRRAGFSVDALVSSLHRVAPAGGQARDEPPTYHDPESRV